MDAQPRLASLDALRGFAIASMVLVNNPGDWGHLYAPLEHAKWNGWTFTDIVFPLFLFAAGLAMTLSLGRRARQGVASSVLLWSTLRRAAVIFLVGVALNFIPALDPATVRIPGVLQRIALCIVIAAPVVIWGGWRGSIAAIAALLAVYCALMLLVPVAGPDGVVAAGRLEPGRDFGAWVDRNVFGAHLWSQSRTWDPEGLVSTLPAAASLLFGVLAGEWLRRGKAPGDRVSAIALAGAGFLALGLAMDGFLLPINKNLWTPSYTVFMTGWSLVLLVFFHGILDESPQPVRERMRRSFLPLTIFGMNALFIFAFSGLVARLIDKAWLYAPIRALRLAPRDASLAYAILFELAMFAVAWLMWKKRWFVKA
jgi:predicted acyltransferase